MYAASRTPDNLKNIEDMRKEAVQNGDSKTEQLTTLAIDGDQDSLDLCVHIIEEYHAYWRGRTPKSVG